MQQEKKGKGYLIANFTINDQEIFQKYVEAAGPVVAKYSGTFTALDRSPKVVEGSVEAIVAIVEFETFAAVETFYYSPEYSAAKQFRIASTTGTVVLADGLPKY